MNKQLDTMKVSGGDYSKVPVRLKEFRQDNPRALVETKPTINEDGSVIFTAHILKDKADANSAESTGTALYNATEMKKPKAFEKLETISVGRALALQGYLNNGEVASTEEMEEFYSYKQDRIDEAVDKLESCETLDDLKEAFKSLGALAAEKRVLEVKDSMKAKIILLEEQDESN
jgi:hypothetical protein